MLCEHAARRPFQVEPLPDLPCEWFPKLLSDLVSKLVVHKIKSIHRNDLSKLWELELYMAQSRAT
jgi:hypothetical protein